MQANWLWGFDQFIGELTGDGKMNKDEFDNDIGDLGDYTEVTDIESQLDDDDE